jgi:hypothetical protein
MVSKVSKLSKLDDKILSDLAPLDTYIYQISELFSPVIKWLGYKVNIIGFISIAEYVLALSMLFTKQKNKPFIFIFIFFAKVTDILDKLYVNKDIEIEYINAIVKMISFIIIFNLMIHIEMKEKMLLNICFLFILLVLIYNIKKKFHKINHLDKLMMSIIIMISVLIYELQKKSSLNNTHSKLNSKLNSQTMNIFLLDDD